MVHDLADCPLPVMESDRSYYGYPVYRLAGRYRISRWRRGQGRLRRSDFEGR